MSANTLTNRGFSTRACLALATAALGAGCAGEPAVERVADTQQLTFAEFEAQTYREPDTGIYIVDGDTPIGDLALLEEFYETYVQQGALIVHRSGGADAKWNDTQKLELTYCVSTTFGARHGAAVQAMADATSAWEAAANVNYTHVSAEDGNCTPNNGKVLFDVGPVNSGGEYLARAFFPGNARASRNVRIDSGAFQSKGSTTLTGILRHELGHTLGFRHEHTRPEAGTCFEDNQWRELTSYDAASVMHYPQCNGKGDQSLNLTAKDKQGAVLLYGAPGANPGNPGDPGGEPNEPDEPGGGMPMTENLSGSVAKGKNVEEGPFDVLAGTPFEVKMTGNGDPDLYVRFGAVPTANQWDCRPYKNGPKETCSLTVPAGQSKAYVLVRGHSAGQYNLAVSYTKP